MPTPCIQLSNGPRRLQVLLIQPLVLGPVRIQRHRKKSEPPTARWLTKKLLPVPSGRLIRINRRNSPMFGPDGRIAKLPRKSGHLCEAAVVPSLLQCCQIILSAAASAGADMAPERDLHLNEAGARLRKCRLRLLQASTLSSAKQLQSLRAQAATRITGADSEDSRSGGADAAGERVPHVVGKRAQRKRIPIVGAEGVLERLAILVAEPTCLQTLPHTIVVPTDAARRRKKR